MYCILVTGMPAAGKSTLAEALGERLKLPVISKDGIKERMFDTIGFRSREEKVKLGIASMKIMYYAAEQLMRAGLSFILENNFERSECGIIELLERYRYAGLTVVLTGDFRVIYRRFLERETSPHRHRGHVVNDRYPEEREEGPEERGNGPGEQRAATISYEDYVRGLERRGFNDFSAGSGRIEVDTTDFSKIDLEKLFAQIAAWKEKALRV